MLKIFSVNACLNMIITANSAQTLSQTDQGGSFLALCWLRGFRTISGNIS